jgi:hypothetical protein
VKDSAGRWVFLALIAGGMAATLTWLDARYGWITTVFDAVAHQFFEVPLLAAIRRPSQLVLVRWHLALGAGLLVIGLFLAAWLGRHARIWLAILGIGYVIRAVVWICGGNLPLVPGDSCHYLEVSTSVLRGEGPVQHYVGSFFIDYPRIRDGRGSLSDWDTPLDAYVRALAYRMAGLGPDAALERRIIVAKACSFVLNILALPAIYGFARRRYSPLVGLWSMAALAVLPVHAIYAGFILRESLVALLAILAVWTLTEIWRAAPGSPAVWAWAVTAGLCGGLVAMARMTGLALLAGAGVFSLIARGWQRLGALLVWGGVAAALCAPWAWATMREYGAPFYSCTKYFEYNFSWTVHHFDRGNTLAAQFYTWRNLPEIVRVKIKSLVLIPLFSTMIVSLPIVAGFCRRLWMRGKPGRDTDLMVATIFVVFVLATLKNIADVTQVAQLGRYYMPVFALMLPGGIAGIAEWVESVGRGARVARWLAAVTCVLLWADPTWAYDASWFGKPFQLHWPALREVGRWVHEHPERVPPEARIMTWFPWELRVTTDRITVLMPRNYSLRRIQEVIRQYGVTHFLWGSFEPPPYYEINPEGWALELEQLRRAIGLTEARELYRSSREVFFPVRLYRLP